MATNLLDSYIDETYGQLLHVDGGVTATPKSVYTGNGYPTALKVSIGSVEVGNIELQGNTITTKNANGDLQLSANGSGAVVISRVGVLGGTIQGITDLAVADGGTGASDAAAARANLGLLGMATQTPSAVTITGGAVSGVSFTFQLVSATDFADATHAVNTSNKSQGRVIWDSSNNKLKVAVGSNAVSAWVDADGTNPVVPV